MINLRIGNKFKLVAIGLNVDEMEILRLGKPIICEGERLGITTNVLVFHGETEVEMIQKLKSEGLIDAEGADEAMDTLKTATLELMGKMAVKDAMEDK